jgi:hypothetical protein
MLVPHGGGQGYASINLKSGSGPAPTRPPRTPTPTPTPTPVRGPLPPPGQIFGWEAAKGELDFQFNEVQVIFGGNKVNIIPTVESHCLRAGRPKYLFWESAV